MPFCLAPIAPDFLVGVGACVVFLSLKYHRLHPKQLLQRLLPLQRHRELKKRFLLLVNDVEGAYASLGKHLRELVNKRLLVKDMKSALWSSRNWCRTCFCFLLFLTFHIILVLFGMPCSSTSYFARSSLWFYLAGRGFVS